MMNTNERIPNCKICDDKKRIWKIIDNTEISTWCRCYELEQNELRYKRLAKEANLENYKHMTFDKYKTQTKKQKEIFTLISNSFNDGYYLWGLYGTGKTHLLAALIWKQIEQKNSAVIISLPQLLDSIRKTMNYETEEKSRIENLAYNITYLSLDDIGKEKVTDWVSERLFMLLDYRWLRKDELVTSFSSQYPVDKLRMDGAIISRIKGMTKDIYLDGDDYRLGSSI